MHNKRTPIIIAIVIAVVLIVLFMIPKLTDPNRGLPTMWNESGIACIAGHSKVSQHFHPRLIVSVDGLQESLSANIGITKNCMAEVHTHDGSGTIHVETIAADKIVYLKDFFTVWGEPIQREGYNLSMQVDDQLNIELGELILKDKQMIVLEYTKK